MPESPYFTELAERMTRIEEGIGKLHTDVALTSQRTLGVERSVSEMQSAQKDGNEKIERVRVFVEGVDGDNGLKRDMAGVKKDLAEIKQYRSDENAVSKAKAGFWTPVKTVIIAVVGSVAASTIAYFLLGRGL